MSETSKVYRGIGCRGVVGRWFRRVEDDLGRGRAGGGGGEVGGGSEF